MNTAAKQTPLHAAHVAAGARMVDFAGWDMPVNYGSQIEEHHALAALPPLKRSGCSACMRCATRWPTRDARSCDWW